MRFVVRVLLPIVLAAAAWAGFRKAVGYYYYEKQDHVSLTRAALWNPSRSENHFLLGDYYWEKDDFDRARGFLVRATELNPYNRVYWRWLGAFYEETGELDLAEQALLNALALKPRLPEYQLEVAEYYFRHGSIEKSLPYFRSALSVGGAKLEETLDFVLQSGSALDVLDRIWPEDVAARLKLLRMICVREAPQLDEPLLALLAQQWNKLMQIPGSTDYSWGGIYIQHLLKKQRFDEARERWTELAAHNGVVDSSFNSRQDYIWNGEFEHAPARTLGWNSPEVDGYVSSRENRDDGEGGSAMRIDFDGTANLTFCGLAQQVVVDPNIEYEFSFDARSEELSTTEGVYFQIIDALRGRTLARTAALRGTNPWHTTTTRVKIPRQTRLLQIRLWRTPSKRVDKNLAGRLVLDSVTLRRVSS